MIHSFNVDLAQEIGVVQAILLENIYFWVSKNEFNQKNIIDGRAWSYNSIRAFTEQFPYLSEKQIRLALAKMEKDGIILVGNHNKVQYDRTKWYAISDKWKERLEKLGYRFAKTGKSICQKGNIHLPKGTNGNDEKGEPIPYTATVTAADTALSKDKGPEATGEYGNSQINEMFKEWEELFGVAQKNSAQNRRACYNLLRGKDKGPDWLRITMRAAHEAQKDRYAGKEVNRNTGFADIQRNYVAIWMWARRIKDRREQINDGGGIVEI